MTATTPEQMRALADKHQDVDRTAHQMWELAARAALRAAADQIEAVQEALAGGSVATPAVVRVANARRVLAIEGEPND